MWTYAWDEAQAHRFVADQYDGPEEVPWASKYAHVYTRFAITTYHQYGLNAPAKLTPARLDRYIETLRPTGARLHFAFAPDWATVVHRSWLTAAPQVALWTAGKQVYEANCAVCHGLRGDGQGMAAHMFRTPPRDFRTGVFKFRSTPVGSLPRDEDLLRVLQRGVRRTAMVAQTHLTEAEQRAAIAYLKTFSPRWREEKPEPSVPIPELPPRRQRASPRGNTSTSKRGAQTVMAQKDAAMDDTQRSSPMIGAGPSGPPTYSNGPSKAVRLSETSIVRSSRAWTEPPCRRWTRR